MTKSGQVDVPPTPNAMLIAGIIDEDKKAKTTPKQILFMRSVGIVGVVFVSTCIVSCNLARD